MRGITALTLAVGVSGGGGEGGLGMSGEDENGLGMSGEKEKGGLGKEEARAVVAALLQVRRNPAVCDTSSS